MVLWRDIGNEAAGLFLRLEDRIEGRFPGVVRLDARIGGRKDIGLLIGDEAGDHRRDAGILVDRLLLVESRGDGDFLACDIGLGEGHALAAVEGRREERAGALQDRAGGKALGRRDGQDGDDAALLVATVDAVLVGNRALALVLAAQRRLDAAGKLHPCPALHAAGRHRIGEGDLDLMHGTGRRAGQHHGLVAALAVEAGEIGGKVRMGGLRRKARDEAETDGEGDFPFPGRFKHARRQGCGTHLPELPERREKAACTCMTTATLTQLTTPHPDARAGPSAEKHSAGLPARICS